MVLWYNYRFRILMGIISCLPHELTGFESRSAQQIPSLWVDVLVPSSGFRHLRLCPVFRLHVDVEFVTFRHQRELENIIKRHRHELDKLRRKRKSKSKGKQSASNKGQQLTTQGQQQISKQEIRNKHKPTPITKQPAPTAGPQQIQVFIDFFGTHVEIMPVRMRFHTSFGQEALFSVAVAIVHDTYEIAKCV